MQTLYTVTFEPKQRIEPLTVSAADLVDLGEQIAARVGPALGLEAYAFQIGDGFGAIAHADRTEHPVPFIVTRQEQ